MQTNYPIHLSKAIIGCMYECAVVNSLGTGLATLCQHWDQSSGSSSADNTANIALVNMWIGSQLTHLNWS